MAQRLTVLKLSLRTDYDPKTKLDTKRCGEHTYPILSYRIEQLGNSVSVVYQFKDGQAMRYNDLESVEAAKQWAQNYHNKYGASHE